MTDTMSDVLIDHLFSMFVDSLKPDFQQRILNDPEPDREFDDIMIDDGRFCFTLNGLHRLVQTVYPIDYYAFQQRLYASNLNERLAEMGLSVVMHQSTGKVASNWYRLEEL
ncbi:hypothetical protein [Litoribrevibacter albus]|uniref:Uncharacterized protein n=1 Tax=Litoribrevibacter albus TaxID=1473156 RepID=A0AA37W6I3_9GAMM|nr:hypothetical protein [Litoribrevibacter albus]GLQ29939.1 hypothetical protein GCM10007876_04170 [Litoribrevibacter albus]